MKNWLLIISLLIGVLAQAQVKLNKETGLYERSFKVSKNRQVFINKLVSTDLDVDENLMATGSFTHLINDVVPVVVYYRGQERDGKYIFTAFKLKPGADATLINLEDIPDKQRKLWIPIIIEELDSLEL